MPLEKHPADYLVHRYYPEYRGAFHGELPVTIFPFNESLLKTYILEAMRTN